MSESTNERPPTLYLEVDVAQWLHEIADKYYDGDVGVAMNEELRALKAVETPPADPWAAVNYQLRSRAHGSAQH